MQFRVLMPVRAAMWATLFAMGVVGQTTPKFEVASLKPTVPLTMEQRQAGVLASHFNIDVARVDIRGYPLKNLIAFAYRVPIDGVRGPGWLSDVKFDIQAKPPANSTRDEIPAMLEHLLVERFHLEIRRETQNRDVYALIVGKNGLRIKELPPETPITMKPSIQPNDVTRMDITTTFAGLASFLTPYVDPARPVVDLTRVFGLYRMVIDVNREEVRNSLTSGASSPYPLAVEEFGLKLERRTIPSATIIVDSADRSPDAN